MIALVRWTVGSSPGRIDRMAAAAEIGGSWRTLETVAVLGAWAVAGALVMPVVLRRHDPQAWVRAHHVDWDAPVVPVPVSAG